MRKLKYLQRLLFLLTMGFSLSFVCACGDDEEDEPIQVPNKDENLTNNSTDTMETVDLGLPSGTLWATCNVGASSPEGYGGYYAWGETEEKKEHYWSTYKWCNGSWNSMTKYCINSEYGIVDNKIILDLEDDVAHVKWGGDWRMPTKKDFEELQKNCSFEWMTHNGVNGQLITGPNGNSIFLPAAGGRSDLSVFNKGEGGYYWSATLNGSSGQTAHDFSFRNGGFLWSDNTRSSGRSIRPVQNKKNASSSEYTGTINGHSFVDLGLSVKWATCNVGASSPESFGDYYAWGETNTKSVYSWSTYKWSDDSAFEMLKYSVFGKHVDNKKVLEFEDDVARVKWGGNWRIPTKEEIDELINDCYWIWTNQNGVDGFLITGITGKSIFLPRAGGHEKGAYSFEKFGIYWSSTLDHSSGAITNRAHALLFYYEKKEYWINSNNYITVEDRDLGFSVRPVCD